MNGAAKVVGNRTRPTTHLPTFSFRLVASGHLPAVGRLLLHRRVSLFAMNQAQKNAIDAIPKGTASRMSGSSDLDMPSIETSGMRDVYAICKPISVVGRRPPIRRSISS